MLEEDGKHHQHNQLDWDDTPLTITVNPMQNWVDEDEEQGIEYLMGGKGKRGMSKLGGPTLHLSGAGHLVENEDELDTSDSEEEDSDQEMDSDEEDDSADSGSEEEELDELNECIEARTYSSRGAAGSHHSGLSANSSCSKKGGKRGHRGEEQLEWDSTI